MKIDPSKPFTVHISKPWSRIKAAFSLVVYGSFTIVPPLDKLPKEPNGKQA